MTEIPLHAPVPAHRAGRSVHLEASSERSLEVRALAVASAAGVLVAAAGLIAFRLEPAPIAGPGSVGQFTAIASALTALVAFAVGRAMVQRRGSRPPLRVLDYLDIAALAFAHAVIALLSWILLAAVLERSFIGAQVFPVAVVVLSAAGAAITGYVVFVSATHMDLELLALVLAAFLALGILASMLATSDPDWWKDNLSALGATTSVSARAFNLTLIVGGFIITTLARYVTLDIPTPRAHGRRAVRICLLLMGVLLALVGIFPVDAFFAVHTGAALGMVVVFGVLVFRMRAWVPGMPRTFVALGYAFLLVTVALLTLFLVGYYTLTAVELVAAVLVFAWVIVFIRNVSALRIDVDTGE